MVKKKKTEQKKPAKRIMSCILSFLIAVFCTMLSYVLGGYLGFFSTGHMFSSMEKESYYNGTLEYFTRAAQDLSIPMGVPEEALVGIVSIGNVKTDVEGYLKATLNKGRYEFNTELLQSKLEENVRKSFESEGLTLTAEQEETLPKYTKMVADKYISAMKFPAATYIGKARNMYKTLMLVGIPICLLLAFVSAVMLPRIYYWRHRGTRYIVYGTLGAALMTMLVPIVFMIKRPYQYLNLEPEYFKKFAIRYIDGGLMSFVYIGIFWIVVSVLLLVLIHFMKEMARQRQNKRKR